MIARFERGEVLLTTRMSDVFLRFCHSVVSRYVPLSQLHSKGVEVQSGQAGRLGKRKPAPRIKAAGQLNLHMAFSLSRPKRQIGQGLLVEFERDAHRASLAPFSRGVNRPL